MPVAKSITETRLCHYERLTRYKEATCYNRRLHFHSQRIVQIETGAFGSMSVLIEPVSPIDKARLHHVLPIGLCRLHLPLAPPHQSAATHRHARVFGRRYWSL